MSTMTAKKTTKRRSPKHYESSEEHESNNSEEHESNNSEDKKSFQKNVNDQEEYLEEYLEEKKEPKVAQTFEHYYKMKGMASLFNIYTDAVIKLEYDYNLYVSKLKKLTDKISLNENDDKKNKKLFLKKSKLESGLKIIKKRMQNILFTVSKSLTNAAKSLE